MQLFVYTLDSILFEGEIAKVSLPGEEGQATILPGHEPLVMTLATGAIAATTQEEAESSFQVSGGVVRANQDSVVVLAH